MAYYPQNATGLNYITYPNSATADGGVALTSGGSANTKGSYVQVVASTTFDSNFAIINVNFTSNTIGDQFLLDIATGGAGSETVVVPNILMTGGTAGTARWGTQAYGVPLQIASGSRVAARCACSTASHNLSFTITLVAAGGVNGVSSFTNYGANTGTSGGIAIDPGGVANTKGSYVEITSSTTAVAQWIGVMFTLGGNTAPASGSQWCIDIATGGAGSETVLIPNLAVNGVTQTGWGLFPRFYGMLTYIASGTRIAMRASCAITDATDRVITAALLTAVAPSEASSGGGSFPFVG